MTVSVLNLRPGDPQGEPKEPTGDPERAGRGARELTGGACRGQKEYQEQPKSPGRAQRRNKTINEPRVMAPQMMMLVMRTVVMMRISYRWSQIGDATRRKNDAIKILVEPSRRRHQTARTTPLSLGRSQIGDGTGAYKRHHSFFGGAQQATPPDRKNKSIGGAK